MDAALSADEASKAMRNRRTNVFESTMHFIEIAPKNRQFAFAFCKRLVARLQ
jgi:hypothetical protein